MMDQWSKFLPELREKKPEVFSAYYKFRRATYNLKYLEDIETYLQTSGTPYNELLDLALIYHAVVEDNDAEKARIYSCRFFLENESAFYSETECDLVVDAILYTAHYKLTSSSSELSKNLVRATLSAFAQEDRRGVYNRMALDNFLSDDAFDGLEFIDSLVVYLEELFENIRHNYYYDEAHKLFWFSIYDAIHKDIIKYKSLRIKKEFKERLRNKSRLRSEIE